MSVERAPAFVHGSIFPSSPSSSLVRIETAVPFGPRTRASTKPARFCPKSTVNTPGSVSTILTGLRGSSIRTGGSSFASRRYFSIPSDMTAGRHPAADAPGRHQLGSASDASYVSPW